MPSFLELIRENTGSSAFDSGSVYGYLYNQPVPDYGIKLDLDYKHNEVLLTIETAGFLEAVLCQDDELNLEFSAFIEEKNGDYYEMVELFAESKGLEIASKENTYNCENDLSQNILFHFLVPKDSDSSDWYYNDDLVIVVQTHNGCDARGGYSSPVFCKPSGDSQEYLNWTCGYYSLEGSDGSDPSSQFQSGYSSNPSYQLNKAIEKIISHSDSDFTVLLKSGETLTLSPDSYYLSGKLKIIASGQEDDTAK